MSQINTEIKLLSNESYNLNNKLKSDKTEYNRLYDLIKKKLKRRINIYGTIYDPANKSDLTDFRILSSTNMESKFFIYNENFNLFNNKTSTNEGAGNGFMRKYRQDNISNKSASEPKIKSLGIPTAQGDEKMETVVLSIKQIYDFINSNQNITDVFYSADHITNSMNLGLGIFATYPFAQANIVEISRLLNNMFFELSKSYDVHLYQLTKDGTTEQVLNEK